MLTWLMWLLVRDRPEEVGLPRVSDEEEGQRMPVLASLRLIFGSGMRWPYAAIFFFMYGSLMVYQGLLGGPFFRDVLGWDKAAYGFSLTFVGVGMIAGCPVAGFISDRVLRSRRRVVVIGTAAFAVMWGAIWMTAGQVHDQWAYVILHFTFGFFAGWYVPIYGQVKDSFPRAMSGTALAALNVFPFAGAAVLQLAAGNMAADGALADYRSVWALMTAGMVAAFVLAALSREDGPAR